MSQDAHTPLLLLPDLRQVWEQDRAMHARLARLTYVAQSEVIPQPEARSGWFGSIFHSRPRLHRGLFAKEFIRAEEWIGEYRGLKIPLSEIPNYGEDTTYAISSPNIRKNGEICMIFGDNALRFANDAPKNHTVFEDGTFVQGATARLTDTHMFAVKDLQPGTEITWNYRGGREWTPYF